MQEMKPRVSVWMAKSLIISLARALYAQIIHFCIQIYIYTIIIIILTFSLKTIKLQLYIKGK